MTKPITVIPLENGARAEEKISELSSPLIEEVDVTLKVQPTQTQSDGYCQLKSISTAFQPLLWIDYVLQYFILNSYISTVLSHLLPQGLRYSKNLN